MDRNLINELHKKAIAMAEAIVADENLPDEFKLPSRILIADIHKEMGGLTAVVMEQFNKPNSDKALLTEAVEYLERVKEGFCSFIDTHPALKDIIAEFELI